MTAQSPALQPLALIVLLALLLNGCSRGEPPVSGFEVAAKGVHAGAISEDGEYASVGSIYHGGSLWRLADGERLYNWNHQPDETTTLVASDFSPDGRWALTADTHTLVLWSMEDGQALRYWTAPGDILSVALSRGGDYALLGLSDHTAVLFDIKRGGVLRRFTHKNRVRSVDFSRDGRLALTGSEDYTAALWDVDSGRQLMTMQHDDDVQMVALSPDGRLALTAAKYDSARVWDTRSGDLLGELPMRAEQLKRGLRFTASRFSEDGNQLLTGRPDQLVQLWDSRSLTLQQTWELPRRDAWKPTGAAVLAVGFGRQPGQYLALASNGFVHRLQRQP